MAVYQNETKGKNIDALSTASANAAGQGVFAQRARPPRALGPRGEVLTFSRVDAEAQQQLAVLIQSGGKRLFEETIRDLASHVDVSQYQAGTQAGAPGCCQTLFK